MLAVKGAWFVIAIFISLFSILSSAVIFWRAIEIVQSLDYTKSEQYVIVGLIGFLLMWLCSLATGSAESIIEKQLIKEHKK
jgi:hypothetical protein